jgi:hypothetical protein
MLNKCYAFVTVLSFFHYFSTSSPACKIALKGQLGRKGPSYSADFPHPKCSADDNTRPLTYSVGSLLADTPSKNNQPS